MNQSIDYNGIVNVSIRIGDNIINLSGHNKGTKHLKQSLCLFLTHNFSSVEDRQRNYTPIYYYPQYINLMYEERVGGGYAEPRSFLSYMQPLTSFEYIEEDATLTDYVSTPEIGNPYYPPVAKFTGVINYSNLTEAVSPDDNGKFTLVLMSGKNFSDTSQPIAYIPISAKQLSQISPGTSAIIEWKLFFTDRS